MKKLFILFALLAFVGLSTDVMAQQETVTKKAKATKVSLSSVQKAETKKACCASKAGEKASCSSKAGKAEATKVSMATKETKKSATKACCASKAGEKASCSSKATKTAAVNETKKSAKRPAARTEAKLGKAPARTAEN